MEIIKVTQENLNSLKGKNLRLWHFTATKDMLTYMIPGDEDKYLIFLLCETIIAKVGWKVENPNLTKVDSNFIKIKDTGIEIICQECIFNDTFGVNMASEHECPVCGYHEPTGGKCSSCGNQIGKDFDKNTKEIRFYWLRHIWIQSGCKWHGESSLKPIDWTPYAQMKKANLSYPISSTLNTFYDMHLINDNGLKEWANSYLEDELPFISDVTLSANIKSIEKTGITETNQSIKYMWSIPKRKLSFSEEFALRIHSLNLDDPRETYKCIKWISENSKGLDTNRMDVFFGNQMNEYFSQKGNVDPYDFLASKFDELKESTQKLNDQLWDEIK